MRGAVDDEHHRRGVERLHNRGDTLTCHAKSLVKQPSQEPQTWHARRSCPSGRCATWSRACRAAGQAASQCTLKLATHWQADRELAADKSPNSANATSVPRVCKAPDILFICDEKHTAVPDALPPRNIAVPAFHKSTCMCVTHRPGHACCEPDSLVGSYVTVAGSIQPCTADSGVTSYSWRTVCPPPTLPHQAPCVSPGCDRKQVSARPVQVQAQKARSSETRGSASDQLCSFKPCCSAKSPPSLISLKA